MRVDFFYSQFNRERVVFEERINMMKFDDHDEFSFDCKFETNGKKSRSNVLKIDSDKIKSLNLIEDIFGKMSETVYLTRNQMNKLSTKMYNSLKIEQVYEISEHQFNEKFVSNLIELVGESSFESVDFDLALNSLSKYSFDKKQDFKLDLLNEEMNKIFKIQNDVNSNYHIVVNTDLNNKTHVFIDTLFDAKSTSEFVQSRENDWQNKILNLEDQLYELNTFSQLFYLKNPYLKKHHLFLIEFLHCSTMLNLNKNLHCMLRIVCPNQVIYLTNLNRNIHLKKE